MKTTCTHCKTEIEIEDDLAGSMVYCPNCGQETYADDSSKLKRLGNAKRHAANMRRRAMYEKPTAPETPVNVPLCVVLGLCFNLVGVIIAACISRGTGAKYAAYGMLANFVVAVLFGLL